MALFDFLKPKWQRSNPQSRITGIAQLYDQDVLNGLAENDPNQSVRETASKRLRAEALYRKGKNEMRVGGLKDASLRLLTEAIQADPTHADAYDARSNVYFSMDRTDEGMADMNKSFELLKQQGGKLRGNAIG